MQQQKATAKVDHLTLFFDYLTTKSQSNRQKTLKHSKSGNAVHKKPTKQESYGKVQKKGTLFKNKQHI